MKPASEVRTWCLVLLLSVTLVVSGGCGVKGPPVAPEDLLPDSTETPIEDKEEDAQDSEFD